MTGALHVPGEHFPASGEEESLSARSARNLLLLSSLEEGVEEEGKVDRKREEGENVQNVQTSACPPLQAVADAWFAWDQLSRDPIRAGRFEDVLQLAADQIGITATELRIELLDGRRQGLTHHAAVAMASWFLRVELLDRAEVEAVA